MMDLKNRAAAEEKNVMRKLIVLLVTISELLRRRQTNAQIIPFDIQSAAALGHRV